jgi:hypothetical protein
MGRKVQAIARKSRRAGDMPAALSRKISYSNELVEMIVARPANGRLGALAAAPVSHSRPVMSDPKSVNADSRFVFEG